ncbi:transcriptional regulator [Amycolatopsis acidiphila]|uniref:FMN-binding negative transcriptional regulator n=1 Tax=Amycolatopsis acidiphila TaxID=715473 RepID=A0A557ZX56_9PSEU|nr:FMN-binding negative transcriptional regulator [Amycolatopsis acidiphila]GHG98968.1 transcriptional regulator [Amycolatopsis acidiphila]
MFVPRQYRPPDVSWMLRLMRGNPLALMATNGDPGRAPLATHLPVILDPESPLPDSDSLAGLGLLAHLNRANPQWIQVRPGMEVLFSFTGPHSYVSPVVYGLPTAAPTWDFTAVQVRGEIVERFESPEDTLRVVTATVRAYERDFGAGWDMTGSIPYFRQILPGVGAFRVRALSVEGMFKLSQEQPEDVREKVRDHFAHRGQGRDLELAGLMANPRAASACPCAGQFEELKHGV